MPILRSGEGGSGRWAGEGSADVVTHPSRQVRLQPSSLHTALSFDMWLVDFGPQLLPHAGDHMKLLDAPGAPLRRNLHIE